MPYFEFIGEDKESEAAFSSKYWQIDQVGKKLNIRFGKIGTDGQLTAKEFASEEDASQEYEKLIRSKTKKGYIEKPSSHI